MQAKTITAIVLMLLSLEQPANASSNLLTRMSARLGKAVTEVLPPRVTQKLIVGFAAATITTSAYSCCGFIDDAPFTSISAANNAISQLTNPHADYTVQSITDKLKLLLLADKNIDPATLLTAIESTEDKIVLLVTGEEDFAQLDENIDPATLLTALESTEDKIVLLVTGEEDFAQLKDILATSNMQIVTPTSLLANQQEETSTAPITAQEALHAKNQQRLSPLAAAAVAVLASWMLTTSVAAFLYEVLHIGGFRLLVISQANSAASAVLIFHLLS